MKRDYLGTACAVSIGLLGAVLIVGVYINGKKDIARIEIEREMIERGYIIYERDLNRNGILEKFYEIDGNKAFLSVDGKSIEDSFND